MSPPGAFGIFRIAPPLTVSVPEIDNALLILDQAIGSVLSEELSRRRCYWACRGASLDQEIVKRGRKDDKNLTKSSHSTLSMSSTNALPVRFATMIY